MPGSELPRLPKPDVFWQNAVLRKEIEKMLGYPVRHVAESESLFIEKSIFLGNATRPAS